MKNNSSYSFPADVVRVVAIIGVVIIHVTNAVYTRLDFFGAPTWFATVFLDSFSRISIPLFIMLSGFLLLGKEESFEKSLSRISKRIFIPFIFWLLFYLWYGGGIPYIYRINAEIFSNIFKGNVYHLYFLVIVIGLYFTAPLFRAFLKTASTKQQNLLVRMLIAIGIVEVAFQFLLQTCASENFFTRWIPYAGFFAAGYVLLKNNEKIKSSLLYLVYFSTLFATFALNYLFYFLLRDQVKIMSGAGCLSHYSDHYVSINVVLMSIAAFLLLMRFDYRLILKNSLFVNIIKSIAGASFGIYLMHPFIGRYLEMQFHLAVDFSSLPIPILISLKLFLTFAISYIATLIILKIPYVKLIVGGRQ